jgi:hypothetical protein
MLSSKPRNIFAKILTMAALEILSSLGTAALTEGIKFLYSQASEILKRWRQKKDAEEKSTSQLNQSEPLQIELPSTVFEGQLSNPRIHFDAVQELESELRALRGDLLDYAEGLEMVGITDENLLQTIDLLRDILEKVYKQHLTFKGEDRPSSGLLVESKVDVQQIAGHVAAVRARKAKSGTIKADGKAGTVELGGELIGVDIDEIGD